MIAGTELLDAACLWFMRAEALFIHSDRFGPQSHLTHQTLGVAWIEKKKKNWVLLHSIVFRIYGLGLRASEDKQATCTGSIRYCVVCTKKVICALPCDRTTDHT